MREEIFLGSFEEQVLLAMVRTADDAYGMNIRREIAATTGRNVAIGAVYATLDRLESKKLARSFRAVRDGRDRRMFAITRTGALALADTSRMRARLWRGVSMPELIEG